MSDAVPVAADPRLLRTREALAAALHRRLEVGSLDAISVAELCREAGVHRTTFYAHAQSVHAFAVDEFSRNLDAISSVSVTPVETDTAGVAARYFESLLQQLEHVAAERHAYRALFAATNGGLFRALLTERLRHRARRALDVWRERAVDGAPETAQARDEAAAFIAAGLVAAIEVWALGDDTDATVAAVRIASLMPGWWPRRAEYRA